MSAIVATARKSALLIAGVLVLMVAVIATVLTSESAATAVPAPSVKTSVEVVSTTVLGGGTIATSGVGNIG